MAIKKQPQAGVLGLQVLDSLMSRLVNATFINGYDGWSFLMLGKVAGRLTARLLFGVGPR